MDSGAAWSFTRICDPNYESCSPPTTTVYLSPDYGDCLEALNTETGICQPQEFT